MSAVEICRRFVERINAHDLAGLAAQLAPDHRFIDSGGAQLVGRDKAAEGWRARIRDGLVPEWQVHADNEPLRRCMRASSAPAPGR